MGALKQVLTAAHQYERKTIRRPGLATDMSGGATYDIFQVAGAVQIQFMFGHVTTVIGGDSANLIRLMWTPTIAGNRVPLNAASATIANDPVNTLYVWQGTIAGQLIPATAIGQCPTDQAPWAGEPILLPAGVIDVDNPTGANTGIIDWYILYRPMLAGAEITIL